MDLEKFISHDEETNISQCLVPECHTVFVGKNKLAIKRHYRFAHNVDIEYKNNADMSNIHTSIHSNINVGEVNPLVNYSIKYLNDKPKAKLKSNNMPQDSLEDKGYRTCLVADYVEYCKQTNISKCLIKNCERPMSGRRTGNIKRHYHKVHNFIIVHDNHETIRAMNKELSLYYNNDSFGDSTFDEEMEDEMSDVSEHNPGAIINFEQYIDYDPLINKSLCKVPGCKTYLEGRKLVSIRRHYELVHNYDIESSGSKLHNSKYLKISNGPFQTTSIISAEDLVVFDINSASYQCLFINCNEILEKHLPTLKRHYHETHKIIIAKFLDNIPHRFYRKRKHLNANNHYESEFSRADEEYIDETASCFIKNELLSDEELPHCSKKPNTNSSCVKELDIYSDKKENNNKNLQSTPAKMEIVMTKLAFLKICLDLIIERGLNISLFDDEKLFKKLLVPFEKVFDCHVNSTVMEGLMIKANNIVVNNLMGKFTDKIVCLELYVLNFEKKYYLIFNVRFMNDQTICNVIIGFLPITETTALPIFEYLSKFNIDKQQVYMTTILTDLQDNEEMNQICNNLCKHNPDLKSHPICDIQTILRSFVKKYSEDIKSWQELVNYKSKSNTDVFPNLKEFANCMENIVETEIELKPQLKQAKLLLKSLKILNNFREKLSEEQYVVGDFYRDWLCCELELKSELMKNNNDYAGKLYEDLTEAKNILLQSSEFIAALYLDARFNFLGSQLLSDVQKAKAKLFLCTTWENYKKYIQSSNNCIDPLLINEDSNDNSNDDEYALLNQHINDIMPVKSSFCIEDLLTNCVPTKREPFSLNVIKYWPCKGEGLNDINDLRKITFSYSSSQYILNYLQTNFTIFQDSDKFDKFLIKSNQIILEENIDLIFEDLI